MASSRVSCKNDGNFCCRQASFTLEIFVLKFLFKISLEFRHKNFHCERGLRPHRSIRWVRLIATDCVLVIPAEPVRSRDAVQNIHEEPYIRWGSKSTVGRGNFGGFQPIRICCLVAEPYFMQQKVSFTHQ